MRSVIIGGAGFIGRHLWRYLKDSDVTIIDDLSAKHANPPEGAHLVQLDLCDLEPSHLEGAKYVFHLGALSTVGACNTDPDRAWAVNVGGTARVLESALIARVDCCVFASSAAVYQSKSGPISEPDSTYPRTIYGASKLAAEQVVQYYGRNSGMCATSLRFFNVYGPGQNPDSVVAKAIEAALAETELEMFGAGDAVRDFVHVDDVVLAMVAAAAKREPGAYNVGTGRGTTVKDLARIVGCQTRVGPSRAGDQANSVANTGRAKWKLGYNARIKLKDGIRFTMEAEADAASRARDQSQADRNAPPNDPFYP